jgi:adenylate cyclase
MKKVFSSIVRWFGVRRTVGVSWLVALIVLRIIDPGPMEELRLRSFDFYQLLKPRAVTARPVVIVDIDEQSLKAFGQWPWPRTLVADLVTRLRDYHVVATGFDVIFAEPDRLSPELAVATFRNLDEETREKLRRLPNHEDIFAQAISRARVVLGQSGVSAAQLAQQNTGGPVTGFAVRGPDPSDFLVTFAGLLRNVPKLEEAAAGRGLVTINSERDGIVRRVPLVMKAGDQLVPSLTLEMLRVVTNAGAILVKANEAGVQSVVVPGLEIATDENAQLWLYFSEHDPARFVSAKDVIEGRVPADRLAGKLALIGTSAVGLLDLKTTPVDRAMPGVEVQAQVLESMLTRSALLHPNYATVVELAVALVFGALIIVMAPIMSAVSLLFLGGAIAVALLAGSWWLFAWEGMLLDVTFPLWSSFFIYMILVFVNYVREQADRRRIRSAFSQYLSPTLVEQLAGSPEKLVLGGEDRVLTILFSDVRGFTTISETYKDDPHGLTTLMNRLLTPLTNAIIDRKGTIDKYMGDAVMAFWNAPLDDPAHEVNACAAALDMMDRIAQLNREREEEAREHGRTFIPIKIGVGLNTGRCVVGNMGSDLRFQYTVLGDSVNLASRLEGQTKNYGVPILIGSQTARAAKDFAMVEVDLIRVKGKMEPEHVYAVVGRPEVAGSGEFQKARELVTELVRNYRQQQWDLALRAIEAGRAVCPAFDLGELLDLYFERIREFQINPPPAGWNGVYVSETK